MKKHFLKTTTALVALSAAALWAAPAGFVASPVAAADEAGLSVDIPFESFTLDNGLRVVVHEDRKAPIVAVSVWYHVGSKDEPEGKTGFAHLFEHLMFNGSENYDGEFFEPLEQVGATGLNGTTWFDRTNYFETVPTPALDMILWLESDRMGHLLGAVTQEKLDEQRGVVQNEKRQGDNQPYGKAEYAMLEGLYPPGHPYRHSTIGSLEDLDAASLDDVKNWFKEYYGAANTVLVLAGDIDAATAKPLVEKYFGDIAAGPNLTRAKSWVPTRTQNTTQTMVDNVPNTRIERSYAIAPRISKDIYMLDLAAQALGDGKTSRLYKRLVRDTGLASNVSVSVQPFELTSVFNVQIDLQPGKSEDEALKILDEELAKIMKTGVAGDELKRTKTKLLAGRVRGLERIGGFSGKAVALAQGAVYAGDAGFYAKTLDWYNDAANADIIAAANKWLATGYHQITITPEQKYTTLEAGADRSKLPAVGGLPDFDFPAVETATLKNGMKVVLAKRSAVPVVNIALQFDGGFASDQGRKLGTANLTMGMLDEGTKSRSSEEISVALEDLGATLGAGATLDTNVVNLSALKPNLKASLDLMADVVINPSFAGDELERQKALALSRIEREKSNPTQLGLRILPPLLYGTEHAYGVPFTGSGTVADVTAMTSADLKAYHDAVLRSDNATIYVAGDVDMAEMLPLLEKSFGRWAVPSAPKAEKTLPEIKGSSKARVIIVDKPGAPQSLLLAGHLIGASGADDQLAVDTANNVLGGQFTARVNMNLREDKGWSYGAFTFTIDAAGQRPWLVYAPVQTDKTAESIAELIKEVDGLNAGKPATDAELAKIKANDINSLPGRFETAGAVLGSMMESGRFGKPYDDAAKLGEQYQGLDLDAVKEAAKAFDSDKLIWVVLGDRAKIEESIRALNIGDITVETVE